MCFIYYLKLKKVQNFIQQNLKIWELFNVIYKLTDGIVCKKLYNIFQIPDQHFFIYLKHLFLLQLVRLNIRFSVMFFVLHFINFQHSYNILLFSKTILLFYILLAKVMCQFSRILKKLHMYKALKKFHRAANLRIFNLLLFLSFEVKKCGQQNSRVWELFNIIYNLIHGRACNNLYNIFRIAILISFYIKYMLHFCC